MSNLYSTIRGDEEAVANENEKQVSGLDHLLSSLPFLSFGMEVNYDVIMIL
jgi:hypothetical protein